MPSRRWCAFIFTFVCSLAAAVLTAQRQAPPQATPASAGGVDAKRLAALDDAVAGAIADHKLPGAVILVGRGDTIVWRKAYGLRAVVP